MICRCERRKYPLRPTACVVNTNVFRTPNSSSWIQSDIGEIQVILS